MAGPTYKKMKVKVKFLDPFNMFFFGRGGIEDPFNMHEHILASEASHIIYTTLSVAKFLTLWDEMTET